MLEKYTALIMEKVSKKRLLQNVNDVARFHRIQASTGFRAAAEFCKEKLKLWGIEAQIQSYPADEEVIFDTYPSFFEWDCKQAWCDLVYPEKRRIADFVGNNISIIQKSIPADYRDKPIDIVMLGKGTRREDYPELPDIKGKIVFVRGMGPQYTWCFEEGALGIIHDYIAETPGVRTRYDLFDTMTYSSFWWGRGSKKGFGFTLSPREGDLLEAACKKAAAEGKCAQVTCFVDSSLYKGSIENVDAFLPGQTEEEVLITAHLCHPRYSANDNASGVSAGMEALKVIKELIDSGELPPLKRGIRLLLVPEFTGTYAYLDKIKEGRKKFMGGFNADMVGARQVEGYGPLTVTDLPMATPSFVCDLAAAVLEEARRDIADMGTGEKLIPMFNSRVAPFSGGSDHQVLSDPSVGIPTLMLGQWPDKYYHTSDDTPDRIDPHVLSKSATILAAYSYAMANMDEEDMLEVMSKGVERFTEKVNGYIKQYKAGKFTREVFYARLKAYCDYAAQSNEDYLRFFTEEQKPHIKELIEAQNAKLTAIAEVMAGPFKEEEKHWKPSVDMQKYNYIPRRTHFTQLQLRNWEGFLTKEQNEILKDYNEKYGMKAMMGPMSQFDYYVNGVRTLGEIMEIIALQTGYEEWEVMEQHVKVMTALGFMEIVG
ncbi:MAG: DUF4910 domain-containing protein [Eubacteriaceae bacterium]|nr:DUF4910 domain-containing protein [Eubacteriaceae bacterium]